MTSAASKTVPLRTFYICTLPLVVISVAQFCLLVGSSLKTKADPLNGVIRTSEITITNPTGHEAIRLYTSPVSLTNPDGTMESGHRAIAEFVHPNQQVPAISIESSPISGSAIIMADNRRRSFLSLSTDKDGFVLYGADYNHTGKPHFRFQIDPKESLIKLFFNHPQEVLSIDSKKGHTPEITLSADFKSKIKVAEVPK